MSKNNTNNATNTNNNATQNNKKENNNMNNNAKNNTQNTNEISNRQAKELKKRFAKLDKSTIEATSLRLQVTQKAGEIIAENGLLELCESAKDKAVIYQALRDMKALKEIKDGAKGARDAEASELLKAVNAFRFDTGTEETLTAIANNRLKADSKECFELIRTLLNQLGLVANGADAWAEASFYIHSMVTVSCPTVIKFLGDDTTSRINFPEFHRQIVFMMLALVIREDDKHRAGRLERLIEEHETLKTAVEENKKAIEEKAKEAELKKVKKAEREAKKKAKEEAKKNNANTTQETATTEQTNTTNKAQ